MIQYRIPLVDSLFLNRKEVVGGIENFNLLNFVATSDGVHDIHPIGHMTEDGVCNQGFAESIQTRLCGLAYPSVS